MGLSLFRNMVTSIRSKENHEIIGDKSESPTGMLNNLKNLPQVAEGIELIQQWQYVGEVHPELLEDKILDVSNRLRPKRRRRL